MLTRARNRLPEPAVARDIRVRAGLSMERLAREVDVGWQTIWKWETGKAQPRGERLVRYVKALEALQDHSGAA